MMRMSFCLLVGILLLGVRSPVAANYRDGGGFYERISVQERDYYVYEEPAAYAQASAWCNIDSDAGDTWSFGLWAKAGSSNGFGATVPNDEDTLPGSGSGFGSVYESVYAQANDLGEQVTTPDHYYSWAGTGYKSETTLNGDRDVHEEQVWDTVTSEYDVY